MSEEFNPLRTEYLDHIEKQKTSGLSVIKYCETNDLVGHKFSYYRTYGLKPKKTPSKAFADINIKPPPEIKINHSADHFSKVDPEWLAKFINSLLRLK